VLVAHVTGQEGPVGKLFPALVARVLLLLAVLFREVIIKLVLAIPQRVTLGARVEADCPLERNTSVGGLEMVPVDQVGHDDAAHRTLPWHSLF
jgi:hypothetical protein